MRLADFKIIRGVTYSVASASESLAGGGSSDNSNVGVSISSIESVGNPLSSNRCCEMPSFLYLNFLRSQVHSVVTLRWGSK